LISLLHVVVVDEDDVEEVVALVDEGELLIVFEA
jgi:hypothetical protein